MVHLLKKIFRVFGIEVKKYNFYSSQYKIRKTFLERNNIDLIFDVGANTGQFAKECFEMNYKGDIHSFEPIHENFLKLKKNAKSYKKWHVHHVALGAETGTSVINISANSYSSSILPMLSSHEQYSPESKVISTETINIISLDNFCTKANLSYNKKNILLKIDVQGFEESVINGASDTLKFCKLVQLELSFIPLYKDSLLYDEIIKKMKYLGFELFTIIPEFVDIETGKLLQADGLFVNTELNK